MRIGASDTTVQAEFAPTPHTLTVATEGGGSVSASRGAIVGCTSGGGVCAGQYDEASTLTLTATPFAHTTFHAWTGCTPKPNPAECEVTIGASDETVHAVFLPNKHTLTLTPTGPGSLAADSGPISACEAGGGVCAGEYIEGATVTLTATPAPHQAVSWSGCTNSSQDTCEVQIGASDLGVQASFAQATHALTLTKAGTGQGTLTCNGAPCASTYPDATALTLTATPASGSTFAGWSGEGCSGTGACHLTLQADTHVIATFTATTPPVEEKCVVPTLAGKTLAQARSALSAAHCTLGTVAKPKKKKGHKLGPLVVKSSSPEAGTTMAANSKVNLKLGTRAKKKH